MERGGGRNWGSRSHHIRPWSAGVTTVAWRGVGTSPLLAWAPHPPTDARAPPTPCMCPATVGVQVKPLACYPCRACPFRFDATRAAGVSPSCTACAGWITDACAGGDPAAGRRQLCARLHAGLRSLPLTSYASPRSTR
ncbi:hypothetical protein ZWY2020_031376 [Hordeum vulgare]|nr:hypothetical protein ZWY2020_031376 [Hordeum vulgare]